MIKKTKKLKLSVIDRIGEDAEILIASPAVNHGPHPCVRKVWLK